MSSLTDDYVKLSVKVAKAWTAFVEAKIMVLKLNNLAVNYLIFYCQNIPVH